MKRWMTALAVIGLLLAAGSWPGAVSGAGKRSSPGTRGQVRPVQCPAEVGGRGPIYDMQTYWILPGNRRPMCTRSRSGRRGPQRILPAGPHRGARGKLREGQAELDRLTQELRNKGKRRRGACSAAGSRGVGSPGRCASVPGFGGAVFGFRGGHPAAIGREKRHGREAGVRRTGEAESASAAPGALPDGALRHRGGGAHYGTMPFLEM